MQRIQLNPDEEITRKEYLKRKKKQSKDLKKRSKITYFMILGFLVLSIYICAQFYVYSRANSFKYTEGEGISDQTVYNVYYVTEGYTYDPVYSLSSIHTNGFNDRAVYSNSGLTNIQIDKENIYGLKSEGLYCLKKNSNSLEMLVEKGVKKYRIDQQKIYYIVGDDNIVRIYDLVTKEDKETSIKNASEIVIDKNNIFVVQDEKTKKTLSKFDKDGNNRVLLISESNVSYIIQDENKIYYVNKKDENKIYSINKSGDKNEKVADISSVSDKGEIKEIDGSKYMFIVENFLYYIDVNDNNNLYKIHLETKEKTKVISVPIEILQDVDKTVFYKEKNQMGVYLYNLENNFNSQVTKRKIKEFIVDTTQEVNPDMNERRDLVKN